MVHVTENVLVFKSYVYMGNMQESVSKTPKCQWSALCVGLLCNWYKHTYARFKVMTLLQSFLPLPSLYPPTVKLFYYCILKQCFM